MANELLKELIEIGQKIDEGKCSWGELAYLQANKQAVLNYGDAHLCEQAGITEEEFNRGEVNPDLVFEEDFIVMELNDDHEGSIFCTIRIDDGQELVLTEDEVKGLKRIFDHNYSEIEELYHQNYLKYRNE